MQAGENGRNSIVAHAHTKSLEDEQRHREFRPHPRRNSLGGVITRRSSNDGSVPQSIKLRRRASFGASFDSNEKIREAFEGLEGLPASTEIVFRSRDRSRSDERQKMLSSIRWLAAHVPNCVLNRIAFEVNLSRGQLERSTGFFSRSASSSEDDESALSDLSDVEILDTVNKITQTATKLRDSQSFDDGFDYSNSSSTETADEEPVMARPVLRGQLSGRFASPRSDAFRKSLKLSTKVKSTAGTSTNEEIKGRSTIPSSPYRRSLTSNRRSGLSSESPSRRYPRRSSLPRRSPSPVLHPHVSTRRSTQPELAELRHSPDDMRKPKRFSSDGLPKIRKSPSRESLNSAFASLDSAGGGKVKPSSKPGLGESVVRCNDDIMSPSEELPDPGLGRANRKRIMKPFESKTSFVASPRKDPQHERTTEHILSTRPSVTDTKVVSGDLGSEMLCIERPASKEKNILKNPSTATGRARFASDMGARSNPMACADEKPSRDPTEAKLALAEVVAATDNELSEGKQPDSSSAANPWSTPRTAKLPSAVKKSSKKSSKAKALLADFVSDLENETMVERKNKPFNGSLNESVSSAQPVGIASSQGRQRCPQWDEGDAQKQSKEKPKALVALTVSAENPVSNELDRVEIPVEQNRMSSMASPPKAPSVDYASGKEVDKEPLADLERPTGPSEAMSMRADDVSEEPTGIRFRLEGDVHHAEATRSISKNESEDPPSDAYWYMPTEKPNEASSLEPSNNSESVLNDSYARVGTAQHPIEGSAALLMAERADIPGVVETRPFDNRESARTHTILGEIGSDYDGVPEAVPSNTHVANVRSTGTTNRARSLGRSRKKTKAHSMLADFVSDLGQTESEQKTNEDRKPKQSGWDKLSGFDPDLNDPVANPRNSDRLLAKDSKVRSMLSDFVSDLENTSEAKQNNDYVVSNQDVLRNSLLDPSEDLNMAEPQEGAIATPSRERPSGRSQKSRSMLSDFVSDLRSAPIPQQTDVRKQSSRARLSAFVSDINDNPTPTIPEGKAMKKTASERRSGLANTSKAMLADFVSDLDSAPTPTRVGSLKQSSRDKLSAFVSGTNDDPTTTGAKPGKKTSRERISGRGNKSNARSMLADFVSELDAAPMETQNGDHQDHPGDAMLPESASDLKTYSTKPEVRTGKKTGYQRSLGRTKSNARSLLSDFVSDLESTPMATQSDNEKRSRRDGSSTYVSDAIENPTISELPKTKETSGKKFSRMPKTSVTQSVVSSFASDPEGTPTGARTSRPKASSRDTLSAFVSDLHYESNKPQDEAGKKTGLSRRTKTSISQPTWPDVLSDPERAPMANLGKQRKPSRQDVASAFISDVNDNSMLPHTEARTTEKTSRPKSSARVKKSKARSMLSEFVSDLETSEPKDAKPVDGKPGLSVKKSQPSQSPTHEAKESNRNVSEDFNTDEWEIEGPPLRSRRQVTRRKTKSPGSRRMLQDFVSNVSERKQQSGKSGVATTNSTTTLEPSHATRKCSTSMESPQNQPFVASGTRIGASPQPRTGSSSTTERETNVAIEINQRAERRRARRRGSLGSVGSLGSQRSRGSRGSITSMRSVESQLSRISKGSQRSRSGRKRNPTGDVQEQANTAQMPLQRPTEIWKLIHNVAGRVVSSREKLDTDTEERIYRWRDFDRVWMADRELMLKRFGIGFDRMDKAKGDPFPFDSDDERLILSRKYRGPGGGKRSTHPNRRRSLSSRSSNPTTTGSVGRESKGVLALPYACTRQSALLFIDVSGFTKLANLLDPESLSKTINSYFDLIVNEIAEHGGDVLKFAGDAIFAEWKIPSPETDYVTSHNSIFTPVSLAECVLAAAVCAGKIVSELSEFAVFQNGEGIAILNCHCGLAAGVIVGVHVGDQEMRREFLVVGDPIDQISDAANRALHGEVVASKAAIAALSAVAKVDPSARESEEAAVIVDRDNFLFTPQGRTRNSFYDKSNSAASFDDMLSNKGLSLESLKLYRKLISLYVHPVVVANDSYSIEELRQSQPDEVDRRLQEAELRKVYVMFVSPLIQIKVTGDTEVDEPIYDVLNAIMNLTTRELRKFSGHLRQFIVDDKGVVIVATFGLRGSTFPNMVAERALPCTIVIHNALQNELGVQNRIGATVGEAYCGVAGGNKRHEYSVMGPSVNLAARLMSSPENPGILVDEAVKIGADQSYGFNALPPVKAKGYVEPVPIFEPLSPLERSWGRVQPNFVGRKAEILRLLNTGRSLALSKSPCKLIWVTGEVGVGKSSVVVHALEHIRRIMKTNGRRLIVTKTVAKESDQLVPFGVFSMVLSEVLEYCQQWGDERSIHSFGGSIYSLNTLEWETLSGGSRSRSDSTNGAKTSDQLAFLCREINTPPEFAELFGRHLFGLDLRIKKREDGQQRRSSSKAATLRNLVGFMAKAFLRCVQDADLAVLAFDDVQHLDELSWKVLRTVFETSNKVLIICTSPPITKSLCVGWEPEFWHKLNTKYIKNRFVIMNIGPLDEGEILEMIAKTLGFQQKDISSQLHHNVFSQSKGMPNFAHEILESLKRGKTKAGVVDAGNTHGFESVGELILARLDAFDASVRNVLNIGAVLGSSFELVELVTVLREVLGGDDEEQAHHIRKTREALELAVQEGILFLFHSERDEHEALHDSSAGVSQSSPPVDGHQESDIAFGFSFCHEIWRSTILKLMLQERKRDIHRIIAESLKSQLGENNEDYLSRMKLFSHYKASGDQQAASEVAMSVGSSYEALGMHSQCIRLLQDTLAMWKIGHDSVSQDVLDSFTAAELCSVMQLYGAIGKAYSIDGQDRNSVRAYQDALTILGLAPASAEISDRSVLFPIFYGLFDCFKFGQVEDEEERYEKTIIRQFLDETRRHGDPIHYCRALAMQIDLLGRIGHFEEATKHVSELRQIYVPQQHSADLCLDGGSDMAAIAISRSALYHLSLGETKAALAVCRYVTSELMQQLDLRNVHNSFLVIYPVLWAMKSIGLANEARRNFDHFVLQAFRQHYGEGASTPYLPLHGPIMMLLELDEGVVDDLTLYIDWALEEENLRFGSLVNQTMGMYGKCADSISAEICLFVSDHLPHGEEKLQLIQAGLDVALEVTALTKRKGMISARSDIVVIYKQLMIRAKDLVLTVRDGTNVGNKR